MLSELRGRNIVGQAEEEEEEDSATTWRSTCWLSRRMRIGARHRRAKVPFDCVGQRRRRRRPLRLQEFISRPKRTPSGAGGSRGRGAIQRPGQVSLWSSSWSSRPALDGQRYQSERERYRRPGKPLERSATVYMSSPRGACERSHRHRQVTSERAISQVERVERAAGGSGIDRIRRVRASSEASRISE